LKDLGDGDIDLGMVDVREDIGDQEEDVNLEIFSAHNTITY
jgi:hypothetical protein